MNEILALLENECIFSVELLENGMFRFQEECDGYFSTDLNKEQVLKLSEELKELAQQMK